MKILVDAIMHLGDLVNATSVVPFLKKAYPACHITFLTTPEYAELLRLLPDIDDVIPYKYKSGGDVFSPIHMGRRLKKYRFDLSITLDPRLRIAVMMFLAGIPCRVGSSSVFGWPPNKARFFFTDYVDFDNKKCKERPMAENFQNYLRLFTKAEAIPFQMPLRFSTYNSSEYLKMIPDGKVKIAVCLYAPPPRNWPLERYEQVIRHIKENSDAFFVFTGTQADIDLTEHTAKLCGLRGSYINLCGKTSAVDLVSIYQECNFQMNFDNGAGHLAAACGCPTVTLCSDKPAAAVKPLHPLTITVQKNTCRYLNCCSGERMQQCDKRCIHDLSADMVIKAVDDMLYNISNKDHSSC